MNGGKHRHPGRSLTGKKSVPVHKFPKKAVGTHWVGDGRLAVGDWQLVVVGGGWWLEIGG